MYKYKHIKNGGSTNVYPLDDETTMWLESGKTIQELMELSKVKWPDIEFENVSIDLVHHHQYFVYYDLHDSSDYVNYFVLSVEEK